MKKEGRKGGRGREVREGGVGERKEVWESLHTKVQRELKIRVFEESYGYRC